MNRPTPALVTQRRARRLPRLALVLLCAAYLLPGLVGREPWRGPEMAAFGQMWAMAEGLVPWWAPTLGGVPGDAALLPHWLGALFIKGLGPWLGPALAARLPFAVLLALCLALVWYSAFHLARTEAAQPLPLAFGGEAEPVDYARAVADGALLALMATLGLLQPGHETTPELAQLASASLFLYGLAAAPYRSSGSKLAVLLSLPLLAGSGAPAVALALGLGGLVVCGPSRYPQVRGLVVWLAAACAAATLLAVWLGAWRWRSVGLPVEEVPAVARQWLWFMWPAWLLALWTLWRWRRHLTSRHVSAPLLLLAVALATNLAMAGADRALMLGLPGLAVLAAFALPTLKRAASAGIDWFSMLFFTLAALTIWVIYVAMHTGVPAKSAANVAKLLPGFQAEFSGVALLLACAASLAWAWLLRWRTGRHREALWTTLVLPASGVALCWMLLMTLWLPPLEYARSARTWVLKVQPHIPPRTCVAAPRLAPSQVAALEYWGRWTVEARTSGRTPIGEAAIVPPDSPCGVLLLVTRSALRPALPGDWALVAEVKRPTDREEVTLVYRKLPPAAAAP